MTLAVERKERGNYAWALCILGDVASGQDADGRETAQQYFGESLALATDLGMRPLVARCDLRLGKLCRRTGDREQAHQYLTTATTMFREMDMRVWLEQAQAEMAALP